MYTQEDVKRLGEEISARKIEPSLDMGEGSHSFGLGLDVFDPVSGQIITAARPGRTDIGQSEILLTAAQVAVAVATARTSRLHEVRAAGFASLEDAVAAHKRDVEARDLAAKHEAELAALQTTQAEAKAKAAEDAAPKKTPPEDAKKVPADDAKKAAA